MMRTPVKNASSFVRNVNQIGRTPTQAKTRRHVSRVLNSDQMDAILHGHSIPVNTLNRQLNESVPLGVPPSLGDDMKKHRTPAKILNHISQRKVNGAAPPFVEDMNNSPVPPKLAVDMNNNSNNNVTFVAPTKPTSFNGDFCKAFSGWLEKTERDNDKGDFARLKSDLIQLVGKYELEFSGKKI